MHRERVNADTPLIAKARSQLLADIEAFLATHNMYASYFGRDAVGDTALVSRLRAGGDVRLETADKIREFMAGYNPKKKPRRKHANTRA